MRQKIKLSNLCFYIFWTLLQIGKGMGYTAREPKFMILLVMAIPFGILKVFLTRWTFKEIIICVALVALGGLVTLNARVTTYLLSIMCIIFAKDIDLKKAFKIHLFVRGPMFVVRTALAIMGVLDIQVRYRYEFVDNRDVRYALGYDHPNTAQFELLMIIILILILYRERMLLLHYLLAFAYFLFIFTYTDSRTPFYLSFILLPGTYLMSRNRGKTLKRFCAFVGRYNGVMVLAITIIGCLFYRIFPEFTKLGTMASRFKTANDTIRQFPITLFGNAEVSTDLGYIYLLYNAGVITTLLFIVAMNRMMKLQTVKRDAILQLSLVCVAIFLIMEHTAFSVLGNSLLLLISWVVFPPKMKGQTLPQRTEESNACS